MPDDGEQRPPERPDYKVYRSRPKLIRRGGKDGLSALRKEDGPAKGPGEPSGDRPYTTYKAGGGLLEGLRERGGRGKPRVGRPRRTGAPRDGRPWWQWALIGAGCWIALSMVAFGVSAQIQTTKLPDTGGALGGGNNMITQAGTILVIGGDKRGELHSGDPSAASNRPLADTIMLIRAGGGSFRKLGIPRDTLVEVPGFGTEKINSAYALGEGGEDGNVELLTETVENFLGIDVNHAVVVDFDGFVDFINALGGVSVELKHRVCGVIAGGRKNGGQSMRLGKGEHTLDGDQALLLSRIRKNSCNPAESDIDRAARQQLVLAGIKNRLTDPLRVPINFIKGPLIGWTAPKAIVSDMGAFTMPQVAFAALLAGGGSETSVLIPDGAGAGGGLTVSEGEVQEKVEKLIDG